jgi:hypothetical protein
MTRSTTFANYRYSVGSVRVWQKPYSAIWASTVYR